MISILIPVYNTKKIYLEQCINSCLKQTFKEYEIIIVDNGSFLEETKTFLFSLNNDKIKIFYKEREQNKKNLSLALNYGLSKCSNNYVARMDSDDIMMPRRLEEQFIYMNNNKNVDILGGQMFIIPEEIKTNHPKIVTKDIVLQKEWFLNHPTIMFKKQKILELGGYFFDYEHFAEDYELWLRALKNNFVIHNLEDVLVIYRNMETNLTHEEKKFLSYRDNMNSIFKDFVKNYDNIKMPS